MNMLADLVSDRVIEKLEAKQKQWDMEFQANLNTYETDATFGIEFKNITEKQMLEDELIALETKYNKALTDEEYLLAQKISEKIDQIKQKLLNL